MVDVDKQASARRREANRAHGAKLPRDRVRAVPIEAGARLMVTHRCHDRRMFMTPYGDPRLGLPPEETAAQIRNFYGYTLARAFKIYGAKFHGGIQMGNHHHCNITDRYGNRPNFKNSIHSNLARGFNALYGRFDSFWQRGGSCDTVTPSDEETLDDLAYTDCNAVEAGLVKWGRSWPGFTTYGWRFGETREFHLPDWYYDPENPDNEPIIELTRVRPDGIFPELSDDELSEKLFERCRQIEIAKQRDMKKNHRRFVGLKKLAKTKWWKRAKTPEDRFVTKPGFATRDQAKLRELLDRNRIWRGQYGVRRSKFLRGEPTVFPYGAYFLPNVYNVPVEEKPP